MKPREEVVAFSKIMERKLWENDHKGRWLSQTDAYLLKRLHQEVEELVVELKGYHSLHIQRECADVANIAMMISDKRRRK